MVRYMPWMVCIALTALSVWGLRGDRHWPWGTAALFGALSLLGLYDLLQTRHSLWRNFPLIARVRWIMEDLRPFFRAYIVESETEGMPFNHE